MKVMTEAMLTVMYEGLLNHVAQPVRLDSSPHLQLVIPKKLQRSILEEIHSGEYGGGHVGIDKTYNKVRARSIQFHHCQVCQHLPLTYHSVYVGPVQIMPGGYQQQTLGNTSLFAQEC